MGDFLVAETILTKLVDVKAHFFTGEREEKARRIQGLIEELLAALGPEPVNFEDNDLAIRAKRYHLIGAALDCKEDYDATAELHLGEAVKLDPCVEYWNDVGHCLWKKGDTAGMIPYLNSNLYFILLIRSRALLWHGPTNRTEQNISKTALKTTPPGV